MKYYTFTLAIYFSIMTVAEANDAFWYAWLALFPWMVYMGNASNGAKEFDDNNGEN